MQTSPNQRNKCGHENKSTSRSSEQQTEHPRSGVFFGVQTFLKAAGTTAGTFTILQAGSVRTYTANEKLSIASVGARGQAGADIRLVESQNFVALCDVDSDRTADSFRRFQGAKRCEDYRVILEEMDAKIDAVIVATPDHHHF